MKGRNTVSPVFTLAEGASEAALGCHLASVQAKYRDPDRIDAAEFDKLKSALPSLEHYYERERARLRSA